VLSIPLNLVNRTGQNVLDWFVLAEAASRAASSPVFYREAFLGAFYGGYMFWVNFLTVALQALRVSRIVRYLGLAVVACPPWPGAGVMLLRQYGRLAVQQPAHAAVGIS
jgi:hypothetical protein